MDRINKQLIDKLSLGLTEGVNELDEQYQAVQLLPELKLDYPTQLRKEIISVRMYQTKNAGYLEITDDMSMNSLINDLDPDSDYTEDNYPLKNFKTVRNSLSFVADESGCFFKPTESILENAYLFLKEFYDFSKLETIDIFSESGVEELMKKIEEDNSNLEKNIG